MKKLSALLAVLLLILTLVGCSQPVVFDVSFVVDGEVYDTISTSGEEIITIPENPTKEGDSFDGWYWDEGTWKKPFTANSLLDAPISSNMSVYAKWESDKVPYTVTFEANGGTTVAPQEVAVIESSPVTSKENYSFLGWYSDPAFNENTKISFPYTVQANTTLYAKWMSNELRYTVTFETNGGTTIETQEVAVIETSPVTSKDYNTFVAWYTDASLQESTRVTFPFTPKENTTLYAKWSVNFTDGLQLTLQANTNTYAVTGYTGTDSVIVIPSQYKGLDVTSINARAFEGNTMITEVIIPNSIITVGLGAFSECYNLEYVDMSDQLQLLGASAFSNCLKLKEIDLPDTLQNIGGEAFFGCTQLKELYLSSQLINIGTNIVRGCNSLEKLTLPGRITLISLVGDTNDNIPTNLSIIEISKGSTNVCANMLYNCSMVKEVTIPDSVTSIDASAFEGCSNLENMTLPFIGTEKNGTSNTHFGYIFGASAYSVNATYVPQSLKTVVITDCLSIGNYAFYGCSSLTSVTIGNGITSIGNSAFYNCSGLTSVTIPDSVTSIGSSAFSGCSSLVEITLPFVGDGVKTAKEKYQYPIGYIFGIDSYTNGVETKQYYYGSSTITTTNSTYYIPSSLKTVTITGGNIPYGAFYNCSSLTSITIPSGITSIGSGAFYGCSSLTSITIPGSVTSIGVHAFTGCSNLTSITIPGSVTSIGVHAFSGCWDLTSITIPDSVTSIGSWAFYNCDSLASITIPDSVTSIGGSAFYGCLSLTSITIPNSVTSIGTYAFSGCSSLTSITIPGSVTSIGQYAFSSCSSLTSITIPDSVTSIGIYAFSGCSSLKNITIPNSVTRIGAWAFRGCSSLTSITIPDSVTIIAGDAFSNCLSLTSITIPDSITNIGSYAFNNCSSLTSVTIPDSVTSIGDYAFSGCYKLVEIINKSDLSITVGSSNNGYVAYYAKEVHTGDSKIVNYNDYLFYSYNGVNYLLGYVGNDTELVLPDNYNNESYEIYRYAFYNCSSLTSITIPDGVTSIGSAAFDGCPSLTSVTIGNGVTSIGISAFYNCSSLTSITIPDSVTRIGYYAFHKCSSLTSITFNGTGTWYKTTNYNYTGGTMTDVTSPSDNATYFKDTYYNYYWYKK